jgi:hypothetical protein
MVDTAIALPPSGTGIAGANLVVDQDASGNYIPTSKLTTGAAGVNGGFVTPTNPLPVGGADPSGNPQAPTLRLVRGVWQYATQDDLARELLERDALANEAILDKLSMAPVGDVSDPLAVRLVAPTPGVFLPPPSVGYDPRGLQQLICTIAGLATASQRQSRMVYTGNLGFVDVLVMVEVRSAAAATSATGVVNVYAYGSFDGQNFGDTVTGGDAAVTLTVPPNLTIIGAINVVANATTYKSNPMSVASAFGGTLPPYWGIVVENKSGATLLAAGPTYTRWLGVY